MKKLYKLFIRMIIVIVSVVLLLIVVVVLYMQHPKFGAKPEGKRLERMQASKNYKDGSFVNRTYTPSLTEGYSFGKVFYDFIFKKGPRARPKDIIPSVRTDLKTLPEANCLVWFGHSSYLMQINGLKILVDPVFSGNASPVPGSTKAFRGTDVYSVDDMPEIDYLLISHDHYDHLDYETIISLRSKVKKVICGLGVGAHFERWKYSPQNIIELDWDTDINIGKEIKLYALTARHFSGRSFKRDQTLWMSYLLQTPTEKIYIGGDGGYDKHFREIGDLHGPIDIAILENGQYNVAWKAIHFLPGENLQAALDLKAKRVMPVHSAKFDLGLHDWDEPIKEMVRHNEKTGLPLITPRIGELVRLNDTSQVFTAWWETVE